MPVKIAPKITRLIRLSPESVELLNRYELAGGSPDELIDLLLRLHSKVGAEARAYQERLNQLREREKEEEAAEKKILKKLWG
jgi:hypothetical protein